jgi:hypothetical protein
LNKVVDQLIDHLKSQESERFLSSKPLSQHRGQAMLARSDDLAQPVGVGALELRGWDRFHNWGVFKIEVEEGEKT